MKQTVNFCDFCDAFRRMDRQDQFSYGAKEMLFDYFEEVDPDYELDIIAICCEFSETDMEDIAQQYGIDLSDCADYDEQRAVVREYLEDNTTLIGETKTGSFVYAQF